MYSIDTYGNRWFAYARNPRVREQKSSVTAGSIYDRNGVLLASTVDGNRVYQSDKNARQAIVHVLGDSEGQVSNGVEGFQTAYLYGFKASLAERINALFSDEPRHGDDVHLTLDSELCTEIVEFFWRRKLTMGKNGAVFYDSRTGEEGHCPCCPCTLVDTTGAGDAFLSGTVMGLTKGYSLAKSVKAGTHLASATIQVAESSCPKNPKFFEQFED